MFARPINNKRDKVRIGNGLVDISAFDFLRMKLWLVGYCRMWQVVDTLLSNLANSIARDEVCPLNV